MTTIAITRKTSSAKQKQPQTGDSTHHQLQSMTLQSLRVMKTTVSRPKKPMPPEDEEDVLLISVVRSGFG